MKISIKREDEVPMPDETDIITDLVATLLEVKYGMLEIDVTDADAEEELADLIDEIDVALALPGVAEIAIELGNVMGIDDETMFNGYDDEEEQAFRGSFADRYI